MKKCIKCKIICVILMCFIIFPGIVNANETARIHINGLSLRSGEGYYYNDGWKYKEGNYDVLDILSFSLEVNVSKTSEYFIEVYVYDKFHNEVGMSGQLNELKAGKNNVQFDYVISNLQGYLLSETTMKPGGYYFQAIIRTALDTEDEYPILAKSRITYKYFTNKDNHLVISNYICVKYGHIWGNWNITKKQTISAEGKKERKCLVCSKKEEQKLSKLKPSIKLSASSKNIARGYSYDLKVQNIQNGDAIKSISFSKKGIVSYKKSGNTIKLTSKKKLGKTTITIKLKSGLSAKCKITVIKDSFDYEVKDLDYSTRDNIFTVRLKNLSKNTVTIYSKGAKCIDWDYKKYDRNVKNINGKSKVTIKAGKTATLRFKLKSPSTWRGFRRKTIKFKSIIDGRTEWIKISEDDL